MIQIPVPVDPQVRATEPRSIDEAGVTQPVSEDQTASRDERRDQAKICEVPGSKNQCCGGMFEVGQGLLQFCMGRERTTDQAGRSGSGSVLRGCPDCGLNDIGMGRKAQVVVRGEEDDRAAGELDGWTSSGVKGVEVPGQRSVGQLSEAVLKHGDESLEIRGAGVFAPCGAPGTQVWLH